MFKLVMLSAVLVVASCAPHVAIQVPSASSYSSRTEYINHPVAYTQHVQYAAAPVIETVQPVIKTRKVVKTQPIAYAPVQHVQQLAYAPITYTQELVQPVLVKRVKTIKSQPKSLPAPPPTAPKSAKLRTISTPITYSHHQYTPLQYTVPTTHFNTVQFAQYTAQPNIFNTFTNQQQQHIEETAAEDTNEEVEIEATEARSSQDDEDERSVTVEAAQGEEPQIETKQEEVLVKTFKATPHVTYAHAPAVTYAAPAFGYSAPVAYTPNLYTPPGYSYSAAPVAYSGYNQW